MGKNTQNQLQLSLLDKAPTLTSNDAYEIICSSRRPEWEKMIQAVEILEPSLKRHNYPKEYCDSETFFKDLPDPGYYIAALKSVWWNRLVFVDRPRSFLKYEDIKLNPFLQVFNIMRFGKKTKTVQIDKTRIPVATYHYNTAQTQVLNQKITTQALWTYAENYKQIQTQKEIKALEQKVSQLQWELFNAKQGILRHYGYDSKNLEINPRYIELYAIARQLPMNSIQHSVFVNILFLQGFYPACEYLAKYGLNEFWEESDL